MGWEGEPNGFPGRWARRPPPEHQSARNRRKTVSQVPKERKALAEDMGKRFVVAMAARAVWHFVAKLWN
jgi:hypothetical protein